jgi:HEAT repeat protein
LRGFHQTRNRGHQNPGQALGSNELYDVINAEDLLWNCGPQGITPIESRKTTAFPNETLRLSRGVVMNAKDSHDNLIKQFRESKAAQAQDIRAGKTGGDEGWGYIRAAEALLKSQSGIEAFASLLVDEDKNVRTAAAAYLLPHKTAAALQVLQDSARGKDLAAFTAIAAIARWQRGERGFWQEIGAVAQKSLLKQFREANIAHAEAIKTLNTENARRAALGCTHAAERFLKSTAGISELAVLLEDENRDVRVEAAARLLPFKTEEALAVLKDAAHGTDLAAANAATAIRQWEEGSPPL